jgi:hypothetical protein
VVRGGQGLCVPACPSCFLRAETRRRCTTRNNKPGRSGARRARWGGGGIIAAVFDKGSFLRA